MDRNFIRSMHVFKNDSEAATALKDGDMSALEYFYNSYQNTLQLFLKTYCRDAVMVEEMTQDAFIQLWENKHQVNPQLSVKNLLFTIAKNKALDHIRKAQNQSRILRLRPLPDEASFSTLDQVILADYQRLLAKALLQLPARNRQIFALSRSTHLSNIEISQQLNISVKAVEKHITKTLHFLRAFLKTQHILLLLLSFIKLF